MRNEWRVDRTEGECPCGMNSIRYLGESEREARRVYASLIIGFDANDSSTDARVLWVLAETYEDVSRVAHEVPNTVEPTVVVQMERSVDACIRDIDFILPREEYKLLAKLIRFELT